MNPNQQSRGGASLSVLDQTIEQQAESLEVANKAAAEAQNALNSARRQRDRLQTRIETAKAQSLTEIGHAVGILERCTSESGLQAAGVLFQGISDRLKSIETATGDVTF